MPPKKRQVWVCPICETEIVTPLPVKEVWCKGHDQRRHRPAPCELVLSSGAKQRSVVRRPGRRPES